MDHRDNIQLNRYLNDCDKKLGHLDAQSRLDVLSALKEVLITQGEGRPGQMKEILKEAQKSDTLVNRELAKRGLPLVKPKRWWKIFLLTMLFIMLGTVLAIVLAVKSFFPLVNVNDVDGTLELFGSRLVLEKADADYFTKINDQEFITWKKGAKLASGTFDFGGDVTNHSLVVLIKKGELAIRTHKKSEVRYTCYTENQLQKIFSKNDKQFVMNLDAKRSHCLLFVPELLPLGVKVEEGNVNIKNMAQSFDVKVDKGIVYWKQDNKRDFSLGTLEGDLDGDRKLFMNSGPWTVNLWVKEGEVRLR